MRARTRITSIESAGLGYRASVCGALRSFLWFFVLSCAWRSPALAAELRWQAPDGCPSAADLTKELDALLNRPFAEIEAMDFEGVVERDASDGFALALRPLPRDSIAEPGVRLLKGASCHELAEAAVVAIAMALGEHSAREEPVAAQRKTIRQDPSTRASVPDDAPEAPPAPLRPSIGAGALLDVGGLPDLAVGGEVDIALAYRALRVVAFGALFPTQTERARTQAGVGELRLAFAGVMACGAWSRSWLGLVGCGGVELGKIWGKGNDLMQPDHGGIFWRALRAEFGFDLRIATNVALAARAGISAPLARPVFELGGEPIHQPSAVCPRARIGLEFLL